MRSRIFSSSSKFQVIKPNKKKMYNNVYNITIFFLIALVDKCRDSVSLG